MESGDVKRLREGRLLWEMYLREVRPYLWRRAELYALARPLRTLSANGRLVIADGRLPEMIREQIARLDAMVAEIGRQYGIERWSVSERI